MLDDNGLANPSGHHMLPELMRVFTTAKRATFRAQFVEQEPPFSEITALEAIKVSYEYVKNLKA
jgi:hypothetical protein